MTSPRALLLVAMALIAATGCSLALDREQDASIARNECSQSSECGLGECWQGACVASNAELSSVLLEVAPPAGAVEGTVGGLRFLQNLTGLSRSSADNVIDLQPATVVVGSMVASTGCGAPRSLPVEVTFTPRENSYGLPVATYTGRTRRITVGPNTKCARDLTAAGLTVADQFSVRVPSRNVLRGSSGLYDVYVKPLPLGKDEVPAGCALVPQLIRPQQSFGDLAETCLVIPRSEPHKVPVVVPWPASATGEDSLSGWRVDVLHPITGHVLSAQTLLSEEDRVATGPNPHYRREVLYSPVPPSDEAVKELIRLTPPSGVVAPVIQADRVGLQVISEEAAFPSMGPFLPPVKMGGRAQPDDRPADGISGRAIFIAKRLTQVRAGVFASYSTNVVVEPDGDLSAELLPGTYRLLVVPDIGTGYAATESEIDVPCQPDPEGRQPCIPRDARLPQQQRFRNFEVKPAATLVGNVVDDGTGEGVGRVSVDATAAAVGTRTCATDPTNVDCALAPAGVLDIALGDGAFVPRSASGVARSGSFKLTGLDCGECTATAGALFDVLVKPPEETRRAWGHKPNVRVYSGEVDAGKVELPLPIIHSGTVEVRQGNSRVPVENALLRAYVLRDETGARIIDPTGLRSCATVASAGEGASSAHCIRSVLQVAQTTADDEGRFELVLPSRIKEIPVTDQRN